MTDVQSWVDEFAAMGIAVSWRDPEPMIVLDSLTDIGKVIEISRLHKGEVIAFCDFESESITRAFQSGCDKIAEAKVAIEACFGRTSLGRELEELARFEAEPLLLAGKAPERYDYQRHNRVRKSGDYNTYAKGASSVLASADR